MPVIRNLVDWVGHVPHLAAQVAGDRVAGVRHRDISIARAVRGLCSMQRGDDAVMVKRWPVHSFDHNTIKRAHSASSRTSTIKRKGQHTPPSSPPPSIGLHRGLELLLGLWHVEIMWWRTTHAVSASSRHQNHVAAMGSVTTQCMQSVCNHVHTCAGLHDISSAGRHCP